MAIKPTPNNSMFKSLVFDGVDSRDYGIYITGDAVFNSPERDVEMIEIPGRNGAYALDKGRFSNIEVSYPAGIAGDTEADFRQGIRAFRNALASRKGYKRLEDEYNPDEYRMAVYKSGLEVTPTALKAGQFTITFDCQPQRFLKSGETAVSITSGGQITNPTLFESHPLLHLWGYGTVNMLADDQDSQIVINNDEYGAVLLTNKVTKTSNQVHEFFDKSATALLNNDDAVQESAGSVMSIPLDSRVGIDINITNVSVSRTSTYDMDMSYVTARYGTYCTIAFTLPQIDFVYSQTSQYKNSEVNVTVSYTQGGVTKTSSFVVRVHAQSIYNRTRDNISIDLSAYLKTDGNDFYINGAKPISSTMQPIYGISTKRPFSNDADFYVDLDIGEAYREEDGQIINVNNAVTIPAKLPVLKSGANTITYDDTITQFQVVPNWWEV